MTPAGDTPLRSGSVRDPTGQKGTSQRHASCKAPDTGWRSLASPLCAKHFDRVCSLRSRLSRDLTRFREQVKLRKARRILSPRRGLKPEAL